MDKGFVGGTNDPTGLTHLGAREYDPLLGKFVSPDPVVDPEDPQQLNGYTYAHHNPTGLSDAAGLYDDGEVLAPGPFNNVYADTYSPPNEGYHYVLFMASFIPFAGDVFAMVDAEIYESDGDHATTEAIKEGVGASISMMGAFIGSVFRRTVGIDGLGCRYA